MKIKYRESDVPGIVANLTNDFEQACDTYRLALTTRDSNRAKKELSRGNTRGTSIHKFQCTFAWILHDIQKGPRTFIGDKISEAEDLVAHINKISNT